MKPFLRRLRDHFGRPSSNHVPSRPPVDPAAELDAVRRAETEAEIGLGKRIHSFAYQNLEIRLDRDVTGFYRVTVNEGRERRYSFTVLCEQGDYDALLTAFEEILGFLDGDRHLASLPGHDRLKGHYYGS